MDVLVSLGGSMIVPAEIDAGFLADLRKLVREYVARDFRFVLYIGGGNTARIYQKAIPGISQRDQDMIGIAATRLNAELLRSMFADIARAEVVYDPTARIKFSEKVIIAAGWKPGWSTDYDSVLLARNLGISEVVNMTNVDHVYDRDPKQPGAKAIKSLGWDSYLKISGTEWRAGMHLPFDPVASKEAGRLGMRVIIMKGLSNFRRYLDGKSFIGTVIGNQ
ncbi:MAG: UMP kinase [archaeon]